MPAYTRELLLRNYAKVKGVLDRQPTYLELHQLGGGDSGAYRKQFGSYFAFLDWANELDSAEKEVYQRYRPWLSEVESTVMTKSYKMVMLKGMLERGPFNWTRPIRPEDVALFFYHYFIEDEHRKSVDFSDKTLRQLWTYEERGVSQLISKMPMAKWAGSSEGAVEFEGGVFRLTFETSERDSVILHEWTSQIAEYRLHVYFEKKNGPSVI